LTAWLGIWWDNLTPAYRAYRFRDIDFWTGFNAIEARPAFAERERHTRLGKPHYPERQRPAHERFLDWIGVAGNLCAFGREHGKGVSS
jgi:hypothetical protein